MNACKTGGTFASGFDEFGEAYTKHVGWRGFLFAHDCNRDRFQRVMIQK